MLLVFATEIIAKVIFKHHRVRDVKTGPASLEIRFKLVIISTELVIVIILLSSGLLLKLLSIFGAVCSCHFGIPILRLISVHRVAD